MRIEELKQKFGGTQETLARHLGVHQAAVSRWLNSKRAPAGDTLTKIADKTGYSVDWLLGRQTVVLGVNVSHLEQILHRMGELPEWRRAGCQQKLEKMIDTYVCLLEGKEGNHIPLRLISSTSSTARSGKS